MSSTAGAVVFTDIVGFTEYTAIEGDDHALELLELQTTLVRRRLPPTARVVKELGDGLLLWFSDPCEALRTSLDLRDDFRDATEDGTPLWVRMGMHWGRPTPRGDDLIGNDVNLAARIVDVAGPGELLLSQPTIDAVGVDVGEIRLAELGPVVMKGFPEPIRLYRADRA